MKECLGMPSRGLLDEMDYSFQNLHPVLLSHKAKILGCQKLICPLPPEVQVWIEKNKNNFLMEALTYIQYSIEKELHNHNNAVCSKNLVSLHSTNSAAFLKDRSLRCSANWFWKLKRIFKAIWRIIWQEFGQSKQNRFSFLKKKLSLWLPSSLDPCWWFSADGREELLGLFTHDVRPVLCLTHDIKCKIA